jgi:hypothetical protein
MARPAAKTRAKTRAKPTRKKSFIKKVVGSPSRSSKKRSLATRVLKGTAKGTGRLLLKGGKWGVSAAGQRIKRFKSGRSFASDYTPEPGEIPKGVWSRTATTVHGRRFDSPESAMAYSAKVEAEGPPVVRAERPRGELEWRRTGAKAGTVRVRPPRNRKAPTGRHRQAEHRTRADQLVAAYRDKLTEVGSRAVAESGVARDILRAFNELHDSRPGRLSQMEDLALGMEQAMARGAEAVQQYRLKLIKMSFDPAFLVFLNKVQENYEAAARNWTAYIVVVKTELALEIMAAQRRAAGETPDDSTLAG